MQDDNKENKTNFELLPKQAEALQYLYDEEISEVGLFGSAGSSKSFAGIYWGLRMLIQYPHFRLAIIRKNITDTLKSTINTLHEVMRMMGVDKECMKYNRSTNVFTFENGSEIYLISGQQTPQNEDFQNYGSFEWSAIIFEEASELSKTCYDVARTRMRYIPESLKPYKYTFKAIVISNPNIASWIYSYFWVRFENETLPEYMKVIHSVLEDNPYLDESYKKMMRNLPKKQRDRLYLGLFVAQTNMALVEQDKLDNLFKPTYNDNLPVTHISADLSRFGGDKTVVCLWNELNLIKILVYKNQSPVDTAHIVKGIMKEYNLVNNRVCGDADGNGSGFSDTLKCVAIMNGSSALNKENYQNLKTQMYYKFAEIIDDITISALLDGDTIVQIKKEFSAVEKIAKDNAKLRITSKDDIKKLIGVSPDYSDAIIYRCYWELNNKNTGLWHLYT